METILNKIISNYNLTKFTSSIYIKNLVSLDTLIFWDKILSRIKCNSRIEEVAKRLINEKIYLAELLCDKNMNIENVDFVCFSYSWKTTTIDDFINTITVIMKIYNVRYVWLDIFQINQFSKNLSSELEIIKIVYSKCKYHFILNTDSIFRGWCLYEIYLHNLEKKILKSIFLEFSLDKLKPLITINELGQQILCLDFDESQFTFEEDKRYLREMIQNVTKFNVKLNSLVMDYVTDRYINEQSFN